jgi:PIN domain nuclease of toxin-antitoxin system
MSFGKERVNQKVVDFFEEETNKLYFSSISIWEVALKRSSNRKDFAWSANELRGYLLENDFIELPLFGEHVLSFANLPIKHRDPFDRLLVAQAISEGMQLVTADHKLREYGAPVYFLHPENPH